MKKPILKSNRAPRYERPISPVKVLTEAAKRHSTAASKSCNRKK
jgi:hypothetical protein